MPTQVLPSPIPRKSIFERLEEAEATEPLPSINVTLGELKKLTASPDSNSEEIARLVCLDQVLSLQVLRLANSAFYAPPRPVVDVEEGLAFIGLGALRNAVMATKCMESTCSIPQHIFDWKEFWVHSAGVAHITQDLARRLRAPVVPIESFYLMGQFHDVGKIVLSTLMPDAFEEIYRRALEDARPLATLEMEVLGVEHSHLGAWYMERQGIPLPIREAVRFHHSGMREDKPGFLHAAIVRLADHLAHSVGLGQSGNHAPMGDPFCSPDWHWYLSYCDLTGPEEKMLKSTVMRQVNKTALLVRDYIA